MLYIITEDANSARDFWDKAAEVYKGKGNYVMVPLPSGGAGNTTLKAQVSNILNSLVAGDELFVAFDNIANTLNFNVSNFIKSTQVQCMNKSVVFKYTKYFCFEELYLSYDELLNMASAYKFYNELQYVHNQIINGKTYSANDIQLNYFVTSLNSKPNNREHLANQLLMEVTKCIKGHFKILKKAKTLHNQGKCWIENCNDIKNKMNIHQLQNICNMGCTYCCKNCTSIDKIKDIDKKSQLINW